MLFRNQEPISSSELEHPFELAVRTPLDSCSEGVLQYLPRHTAMRRVFGSHRWNQAQQNRVCTFRTTTVEAT
jgi:hypothetical protein